MNITIVGAGYVGLVTGAVFAEKGHHILCIENDSNKLEALRRGEVPFYEPGLQELVDKNTRRGHLEYEDSIARGVAHAQVIFVAVGTPPTATGEADMVYIEKVARSIADELHDYRLIVEKSTVPVHTSEKICRTIQRYARQDVPFDVASNPEFLREGQAISDALNPDRIVLGVPSKRAEKILRELYQNFDAPLIITNVNSAEIIKHAANSFLALKISYINAVANICEAAGADISEVARGIGLDHRIGPHFLKAGIGYGGSCFPKDVDAFVDISEKLGYEFRLLKEVQLINQEQRRRFIKKIKDELWVLQDKIIAILGLSFKPDTDDLREAPSLEIIAELKEQGAQVRAYDPKAANRIREILSTPRENLDNYDGKVREVMTSVTLCHDAYEAAQEADCIVLLTEWQEFSELDFAKIHQQMKQPLLVDGRNLYDPQEMQELGFTYRSIGR